MGKQEITSPFSYPYCDFEFPSWNPVQLECYPYFEKDGNLVISASVASGKSAIAEAIFGYELSRNDTNKVVYVSPLKALGRQKFNEWSRHDTFGKFSKVLVSSDEDIVPEDFVKSRMIISTIESMNIQCRKKASWIKNVRVLCFDEAHLFNDENRGAGAESLLINLSMLNPDCRIVCLSGTLSNCKEIAQWIKNLNGKPTNFVISSWRPTKMEESVEICNDLKSQIKKIESIVSDDVYEKTIVFVHSKKTGEEINKQMNKDGIKCAFYNADLKQNLKDRILEDFQSGYAELNVIIATNSLSMGLNL